MVILISFIRALYNRALIRKYRPVRPIQDYHHTQIITILLLTILLLTYYSFILFFLY